MDSPQTTYLTEMPNGGQMEHLLLGSGSAGTESSGWEPVSPRPWLRPGFDSRLGALRVSGDHNRYEFGYWRNVGGAYLQGLKALGLSQYLQTSQKVMGKQINAHAAQFIPSAKEIKFLIQEGPVPALTKEIPASKRRSAE